MPENPLNELKTLLAEIKSGQQALKDSGATAATKIAAQEVMIADLKAVIAAMPQQQPVEVKTPVFRNGQWSEGDPLVTPHMKAIMNGRAKGWTIKECWNERTDDADLAAWKDQGDLLLIAATGRAVAHKIPMPEAWNSMRTSKAFGAWSGEAEALRKALDTAAVGEGLEFVPTQFSSELIARIRGELRVAALHRRMTMPRSPFVIPALGVTLPVGFLISESTTPNFLTEANKHPELVMETRNVTFTASGLGALGVWSDELDQDSIIPMAEFVRSDLVTSQANAQETAVLNGSETGTHEDFDVTASNDARKAWDGYRVMAVRPSTDTTTDFGGAVTTTKIRALRANMGRYGASPGDLAYVTSVKVGLTHLLNLPEVQTLDKLGPNAVILTGQVAVLDGSPVVLSDFGRDDVSATGFNTTGGPNTKSTLSIVNRRSMWFGDIAGLRVEDFRSIWTNQFIMVVKSRSDFQDVHPSNTQTIAAMAINI